MTKEEYIKENERRWKEISKPYNPASGEGSDCCERVAVHIEDAEYPDMYLPKMMMDEPVIDVICKCGSFSKTAEILNTTIDIIVFAFVEIRENYDFEFWAFSFIKIKEKLSDDAIKRGSIGRSIPFKLNRGQRKLLRYLYALWMAGTPIRIIVLKARQWGCSTLIQIFMMWFQMVLHKQWNSVICAHVENAAKIVRGMYTKALRTYPPVLVEGATGTIELSPYEGSQKTRWIKERECRISIGSSEKPDGLRSEDLNMAHFSEVALFSSTDGKKPEDLIQGVVSGIPYVQDTIIVYKSTAKGVGNFFHREWLRAEKKESNFIPVFVAWFEIETYYAEVDDYNLFIDTLTDKEKRMFEVGATLEHIAWYRNKRKEYSDEWRFISEFPSWAEEAFQSTGHRFFEIGDVNKQRKFCCPPNLVGDIVAEDTHGEGALKNIKFIQREDGHFKIWALPDDVKMGNDRYVVVVDVNRGTSKYADNGIICVFDRFWMKEPGGVPEVVAEWSGRIIMRHFVWVAVQIAKLYQNAFLVIESNTPDSMSSENTELEAVFDEIVRYYDNMYCRTPADQIVQGVPRKWGFQTNKSTKWTVCTHQQLALKEDMYIERCIDAVDEHDTFEIKDNGSLGAVEGCHDDRLITRAIGVWICYQVLRPPYMIGDDYFTSTRKTIINEATL